MVTYIFGVESSSDQSVLILESNMQQLLFYRLAEFVDFWSQNCLLRHQWTHFDSISACMVDSSISYLYQAVNYAIQDCSLGCILSNQGFQEV